MLRLSTNFQRLLRNEIASFLPYRKYNYQKDVYNKKLELPDDKYLHHELKSIYSIRNEQPNLYRFVNAYHKNGHRIAKIDPLKFDQHLGNRQIDELDPRTYNLNLNDNKLYPVKGLLFNCSKDLMTIKEISSYLKNAYSNNISIEFDFIENEEERLWLTKEFETLGTSDIEVKEKNELLQALIKSETLDHFLASKFPTFKRYSCEGAESSMAFYLSLFSNLAKNDIEQLVLGMAHRGRLNLMICLLKLDPCLLFTKLKGKSEFSDDITASGDIAHHFPCSANLNFGIKKINISLLPNPSHLEAVNPLVLGKTRSKQMLLKDCYYEDNPSYCSKKVASFLIHGDAAFAGQGIVSETFQLARLPNYSVGGTIHLIINNQIGFTSPSILGSSGNYCSDLAKGFNCPIIHINGDDPELAYKAAIFAVNYRKKFGKDIIVDLVCFRKFGHNELDDPTFTNPLIYKSINLHNSVVKNYENILVNEAKIISEEEIKNERKAFFNLLNESLNQVIDLSYKIKPKNFYLNKQWSIMNIPSNDLNTKWATGVDVEFLKEIGIKSVGYPENFNIHPTVERAHIKKRIERINKENNIDWSTAEALAFGSLLLQGFNLRLSGQDVGRGTFSQRHAMLINQKTNETYIPLNNLTENQKNFIEICNSFLSEEAVMGFDYGYSIENPNNLVIWEAQFGDFFNGAQIIIDTYISSAESKWMHQSGFVLMLPHGFDGAGPEHSSCRIERFLQMSSSSEDNIDSDNINFHITHPTTPSNYFHLLRRQMIRNYRKPLIIASPKTLLRLPEAVSSLHEFKTDTHFIPVIDDPMVKSKDSVNRLIFVFGKHYYTLQDEKQKKKINNVAIIRIEELSPFPVTEIRKVLKLYKNVKQFVWAQEEHRNMGAWSFVDARFKNILGLNLTYAGRNVQACVSGIGHNHTKEVKDIISKPFSV